MPLVFDENNLLPEGVHDATLEEVVSAFGGTNRRDRLCDGLRQNLDAVKLTGWACEVLIDGSFVMPSVREPNDIDVLLIMPADWDMGRRDFRPFEYNVLSKSHTRRAHRVEVYAVIPGSEEHLYFASLFAKIRIEWCRQFEWPADSRKGLVRVVS